MARPLCRSPVGDRDHPRSCVPCASCPEPPRHLYYSRLVPRFLDIFFSGLGLGVLSPILGLIAACILMTDGPPILYRARRIGLHGKPFGIFKFRTMVTNADRIGAAITVEGDPRVTPFGRFLRRHKLDELPQLVNVLRGEMSLVGPRPEDPRYVERYSEEQRSVLRYRPGITSPASFEFRNEETMINRENREEDYLTRLLPRKLAIEMEYFPNRSLMSDLKLILRTIVGVA